MSTARGDRGRSRGQKHQNSFAFKHNKNSKKTLNILSIQHHGLCQRCDEKIEWRKKFRKYKPIKTARKCVLCEKEHTVTRAYHKLCDDCAKGKHVCPICVDPLPQSSKGSGDLAMLPRANAREIERYVATLRERERRSILRKLDDGTIAIYKQEDGVFVIKEISREDEEEEEEEDDDDDGEENDGEESDDENNDANDDDNDDANDEDDSADDEDNSEGEEDENDDEDDAKSEAAESAVKASPKQVKFADQASAAASTATTTPAATSTEAPVPPAQETVDQSTA
mmetsp:Transcript_17633/g.34684  ORF Transcript_17633/g.34684 Transcript_17633/m.34684 type:complete len:283 (-) Transcript_17633:334-1182(-)|eukprot:CAMPEP_0171553376 /NCGR_PEP_ID=MMETSP0960-20121227/8883_1 /TAXON_ID=87120 /ORGANISM="Aurantiochytrium limacinum, Strain ATCCMYA-1381" /LENGTH=282 /DNA_ID=CAMNT_0012103011 /DNA_START=69 /DNA_END=917 /DNA_ORIENTATION=-